jgi:hypothetical protein
MYMSFVLADLAALFVNTACEPIYATFGPRSVPRSLFAPNQTGRPVKTILPSEPLRCVNASKASCPRRPTTEISFSVAS